MYTSTWLKFNLLLDNSCVAGAQGYDLSTRNVLGPPEVFLKPEKSRILPLVAPGRLWQTGHKGVARHVHLLGRIWTGPTMLLRRALQKHPHSNLGETKTGVLGAGCALDKS